MVDILNESGPRLPQSGNKAFSLFAPIVIHSGLVAIFILLSYSGLLASERYGPYLAMFLMFFFSASLIVQRPGCGATAQAGRTVWVPRLRKHQVPACLDRTDRIWFKVNEPHESIVIYDSGTARLKINDRFRWFVVGSGRRLPNDLPVNVSTRLASFPECVTRSNLCENSQLTTKN